MTRRHTGGLGILLATAEALCAACVFLVLSGVRFGRHEEWTWQRLGVSVMVVAIGYAVVWTTLNWLLGLFRLESRLTLRSHAFDIARAAILLGLAVFTALFSLKLPEVSRLFLIVLFPTQMVVSILLRAAIRWLLVQARRRGYGVQNVLIIGAGPAARQFAAGIARRRELAVRVIGHLATTGKEANQPGVIGRVEDLVSVLHSNVVDEVVICLPPKSLKLIGLVTGVCEEEGRIVRIPHVDGLPRLAGGRIEEFNGAQVQSLVYGPDRAVALLVKRLIDVVGASLLLVVLAPLYAGIGLTILVREGRPILFRQARVGRHGRVFTCLKFRTMATDAETRLEELKARNEIQGHAFKLTDDPRITRTGRFLRRTSLDELPQFWNVLRGQMSLVGPRPPLPAEVAGYDLWHRRRLSMKPGVTGLWQISARRDDVFDRWVALDLKYIDQWGLLTDLQILAGTVPAILLGSGR